MILGIIICVGIILFYLLIMSMAWSCRCTSNEIDKEKELYDKVLKDKKLEGI